MAPPGTAVAWPAPTTLWSLLVVAAAIGGGGEGCTLREAR